MDTLAQQLLREPVLVRFFAALSLLAAFDATVIYAQDTYVSSQIIVRLKDDPARASPTEALDPRFYELSRPLIPALNLYLVHLKTGLSVQQALTSLRSNPRIKYAQPDHRLTWREGREGREPRIPNDPDYSKLWNMTKISAPDAWALGTGGKDKLNNEVVIAIVDGGMDLQHPELIDNLWINRAEIAGNGIDDDGNGYVDDVYGWNAYAHNGIIPSASHGTHVAGIAGARGNNANGIAGVNWDVKIMPVAASSGTTSVVAEGYGYVLTQKKLWLETHGAKGANVVATNSSFGVDYADCQSSDYPVWNDLYDEMGKVGILSAAATANLDLDIDKSGDVPTSCKSDYLITVTNTDDQDQLSSSAGYGLTSIDLGAPGENIFSLVPVSEGLTGVKTGTSMATPHVTGAIGLLHSLASADFARAAQADPAGSALKLKTAILSSVDPLPSLQGKTVSGGRLNLIKAARALGAR